MEFCRYNATFTAKSAKAAKALGLNNGEIRNRKDGFDSSESSVDSLCVFSFLTILSLAFSAVFAVKRI